MDDLLLGTLKSSKLFRNKTGGTDPSSEDEHMLKKLSSRYFIASHMDSSDPIERLIKKSVSDQSSK